MAKYEINTAGVKKAKDMIDAHQYDIDTEWGEGVPSAEEGNAQIDRHGYEGYGQWHLAIDTEATEDTKDRYGFPYGDFQRVYRSALIAAKQRAVQNGHDEVAKVADQVLDRLDKVRA